MPLTELTELPTQPGLWAERNRQRSVYARTRNVAGTIR